MRVTRAQAEENRRRVVETSSRLFREHGFDGIGIADLMKAAGLTQGGFYKQFASKEELAREASEQALEQNLAFWQRMREQGGEQAFTAFVERYLSATHRDAADRGCLLAACSGHTRHRAQPVRAVFSKAVEDYAGLLIEMKRQAGVEMSRPRALAVLSQIVGALMLSRAVDEPALSDEILQAAVARLTDDRR
ncbi:TetR/AcrR family transcriptional regulator [Cupriavidus sp. DB3]|uniref:TetR/AcrR family transcriptional regulator n=1 Tax=Cupriavidus sp. DB3 TaxID=2873259 RepID=UPI001CF5598B|nr:TetR/AcrR family transcriptional regulator [Cupriavidus sp. DB3]MCA7082725.1 TetR/AcrR family transcriptional regulator [Cupriavidus sp. DB3]